MDLAALKDSGSDHSKVSQQFADGVILGAILILVVDLVSSKNGGEVVSGSEPGINKAKNQAVAHNFIGLYRVQGEATPVSAAIAVPKHPPIFIPDEHPSTTVQRFDDHYDNENDTILDHELALLSLSPIWFDSHRPDLLALI
ncbi:hypothetical protein PanWU01x14_198730 [Parasponia andersonii]|uniref:Uncharacterized protein n=1 Tax=Parasponia andersonii TaxID=3476 RepID=A0A2P5BZ23_PARAD|nr:hypothetical protein PanWU01x14_198730 [Parasponia andersonii]